MTKLPHDHGNPVTRREFVEVAIGGLFVGRAGFGSLERTTQQRRPAPSAAQLEWQRDELALFLHFGVNTFTDREWGDGKESPGIFAPTALDARQWTRTARASGFPLPRCLNSRQGKS